MRSLIGVAAEALFASVMLGSSALMFFLGPDFFVILLYGFFPVDMREHLYNFYPPNQFDVSNTSRSLLTLIMALVGLYSASGLWISYPNTRLPMTLIVSAIVGWLVWFLLQPFPMAY